MRCAYREAEVGVEVEGDDGELAADAAGGVDGDVDAGGAVHADVAGARGEDPAVDGGCVEAAALAGGDFAHGLGDEEVARVGEEEFDEALAALRLPWWEDVGLVLALGGDALGATRVAHEAELDDVEEAVAVFGALVDEAGVEVVLAERRADGDDGGVVDAEERDDDLLPDGGVAARKLLHDTDVAPDTLECVEVAGVAVARADVADALAAELECFLVAREDAALTGDAVDDLVNLGEEH